VLLGQQYAELALHLGHVTRDAAPEEMRRAAVSALARDLRALRETGWHGWRAGLRRRVTAWWRAWRAGAGAGAGTGAGAG
jgi:hypothetical protein